MQHLRKILLLFMILSFTTLSVYADTAVTDPSMKKDFRGLWVATVVNIDYPTKPSTDPEVLKNEALKVLNDAQSAGFNAIFLQVRPTADALYPSQYFPWSKHLTGKQGTAPLNGFDPLAFWVTEAHNRGIELHAWINPYRATKKLSGEPKHNLAALAANHPALLFPSWVVKHSDGDIYFNPGIPEVRQLIVNGVLEIINNYAVDGIHFDDYFYPDKSFNDKITYDQYKKANQSLDDWRRENVNALIRDVHNAIKYTGKPVRFGISPFGIWANKSSNPLGSDTKGLESYSSHYADSLSWIREGTIDYITPQIYWNIGYTIADYSKLVDWWKQAVTGSSVDLYIGQAAYRAGNADPSSPWYGTAEIQKQMKFNEQIPVIKGSIFFSYQSLAKNPALMATVKAIHEQRDGKSAAIPVTIARPSGNIRTSFKSFYLSGASDPAKPLYVNGQLIQNRSALGYYGILVPLSEGPNSFTVSQEGTLATSNIYREKSSTPKPMSKAQIITTSTFPQSQEYRMPGETITLSCQAPSGSKVTVKLNGKTYTMKTSATGTSLIPATYTYSYTIPTFTGTPRNIDLGSPVYAMKYKGTVKTATAPAKVGVIMKGSPYYGEILDDVTDTYNTPVSGNGAAFELYKGMIDSVTGMTGSYARLSSGQWVFKSNLKIYALKAPIQPTIQNAEYLIGEKWDTLKLKLSSPSAAYSNFDGTTLKMTVSAKASANQVLLPENSLFSTAAVTGTDAGTVYALTVKGDQRIEGYHIEKTATGVELKVKRKAAISNDPAAPLKGINIIIDPGHGGSESGALGPLGLQYAEKDINLKLGLKLQAELQSLGANVMMTRTTDTTVSLSNRLASSRMIKPDLFVSLHANAMEDNVDVSKIYGFSIFYREALAKKLSTEVYDYTINTLYRNKMGVNVRNFYVTRGTWCPSILLETGFVPNPTEFEWLTNEESQVQLAKSISGAITSYFSK